MAEIECKHGVIASIVLHTKAVLAGDRLGDRSLGYRCFMDTSYDCTALTDLLQISGYSREKAGFSKVCGENNAGSAFCEAHYNYDLFEPVRPSLTHLKNIKYLEAVAPPKLR